MARTVWVPREHASAPPWRPVSWLKPDVAQAQSHLLERVWSLRVSSNPPPHEEDSRDKQMQSGRMRSPPARAAARCEAWACARACVSGLFTQRNVVFSCQACTGVFAAAFQGMVSSTNLLLAPVRLQGGLR